MLGVYKRIYWTFYIYFSAGCLSQAHIRCTQFIVLIRYFDYFTFMDLLLTKHSSFKLNVYHLDLTTFNSYTHDFLFTQELKIKKINTETVG